MALLDAVASEAAGPATLHIPMACLAAMTDGVSASRPAETSVRTSTAIPTTVIDDQYSSTSPTPGLSACRHVARPVSDAVGLARDNMSVSAWQCEDKHSLACLSRQPNSPLSHHWRKLAGLLGT